MTLSPSESLQSAPRRVSSSQPDGITNNGSTVTIRVNGNSYELTDKQLDEAAARVSLERTLKVKPQVPGVAAEQLRSIIERVEKLEEEKAEIASDIKDLYAEAKGNGFNVPTLRKILALRKQDAAERDEAEHLLDSYKAALGMQGSFNFSGDSE